MASGIIRFELYGFEGACKRLVKLAKVFIKTAQIGIGVRTFWIS